MPFALATLIVGGRDALAAFSNEAVADPRVRALTALIDLSEDPAFTAAYPATQTVEVVIRLKDGRAFAGRSDITSGEPTRPHAPAALADKYLALATPLWGAARAAQLCDALLDIDACPDVSRLVDFNP